MFDSVSERRPSSRRFRGRALFAALVAICTFFTPLATASPALANPSAGFNPSHIISDGNFYNGDGMSVAEIQSFLNQRVPRCTIGDPGRAPWSRWGNTFIASTCLKSATFSTASRAANAYCRAYQGGTNESVATIISKIGRSCGISPQVLLVMLEKEQSLITDTWPTARQYDFAMGYACPDSGPNNSANCDPTQTGFPQQVYRAAWQLQVYKAHPNSYNYKPFKVNTIQWHPNAGCGTSQVYIENWATAALYIYTPYRPNQAALNAGWGTGDACSSYGNRNFYNFYTQWFGSPTLALDPKFATLYNSLGGSLGGITGNAVSVAGGLRQNLERGTMYWSNATGAQIVRDGIRVYFDEVGGAESELRFPLGPEKSAAGGAYQEFQGGVITWASSSRQFVVPQSVYSQVVAEGGLAATGLASAGSKRIGSGITQEFDRGLVTVLPGYGNGFVSSPMLAEYRRFGGPEVLGFPNGKQSAYGPGVLQEFQNSTLYQVGNAPALGVLGGIRMYQVGVGGVATTGFPKGGERKLPNGIVAQEFENGTVFWSVSGRAYLKPGPIRDYVAKNGLGRLGNQVGSQVDVAGGSLQEFEWGTLYSKNGEDAIVLGGIRHRQVSVGGVATTGFPKGGERKLSSGIVAQEFENGTVFWSISGDAYLKAGPMRDFVAKNGLGYLGNQVGSQVDVAGGSLQEFSWGTLYSKNGEDAIVLGGIRHRQVSAGGVATTGFPKGGERKLSSGIVAQEFENGTVFWSLSGSAFLKPGPIRDYVAKNGLAALGDEAGPQQTTQAGVEQAFAKGTLRCTLDGICSIAR